MIAYKKADRSDLGAIESLLKQYDLPASDCLPHLEHFVVAFSEGTFVGVGGLERCGEYGLIRSFAVSPDYTGRGIAERLFERVHQHALAQGMVSLYLLTTTADRYFKKRGFSECPRSSCPEPVQRSKQFAELCPDSAVAMCRVL